MRGPPAYNVADLRTDASFTPSHTSLRCFSIIPMTSRLVVLIFNGITPVSQRNKRKREAEPLSLPQNPFHLLSDTDLGKIEYAWACLVCYRYNIWVRVNLNSPTAKGEKAASKVSKIITNKKSNQRFGNRTANPSWESLFTIEEGTQSDDVEENSIALGQSTSVETVGLGSR